jgi:hypothetical protein
MPDPVNMADSTTSGCCGWRSSSWHWQLCSQVHRPSGNITAAVPNCAPPLPQMPQEGIQDRDNVVSIDGVALETMWIQMSPLLSQKQWLFAWSNWHGPLPSRGQAVLFSPTALIASLSQVYGSKPRSHPLSQSGPSSHHGQRWWVHYRQWLILPFVLR